MDYFCLSSSVTDKNGIVKCLKIAVCSLGESFELEITHSDGELVALMNFADLHGLAEMFTQAGKLSELKREA